MQCDVGDTSRPSGGGLKFSPTTSKPGGGKGKPGGGSRPGGGPADSARAGGKASVNQGSHIEALKLAGTEAPCDEGEAGFCGNSADEAPIGNSSFTRSEREILTPGGDAGNGAACMGTWAVPNGLCCILGLKTAPTPLRGEVAVA